MGINGLDNDGLRQNDFGNNNHEKNSKGQDELVRNDLENTHK